VISPSKSGKVSLVRGVGLTLESLNDADVAAFLVRRCRLTPY